MKLTQEQFESVRGPAYQKGFTAGAQWAYMKSGRAYLVENIKDDADVKDHWKNDDIIAKAVGPNGTPDEVKRYVEKFNAKQDKKMHQGESSGQGRNPEEGRKYSKEERDAHKAKLKAEEEQKLQEAVAVAYQKGFERALENLEAKKKSQEQPKEDGKDKMDTS